MSIVIDPVITPSTTIWRSRLFDAHARFHLDGERELQTAGPHVPNPPEPIMITEAITPPATTRPWPRGGRYYELGASSRRPGHTGKHTTTHKMGTTLGRPHGPPEEDIRTPLLSIRSGS